MTEWGVERRLHRARPAARRRRHRRGRDPEPHTTPRRAHDRALRAASTCRAKSPSRTTWATHGGDGMRPTTPGACSVSPRTAATTRRCARPATSSARPRSVRRRWCGSRPSSADRIEVPGEPRSARVHLAFNAEKPGGHLLRRRHAQVPRWRCGSSTPTFAACSRWCAKGRCSSRRPRSRCSSTTRGPARDDGGVVRARHVHPQRLLRRRRVLRDPGHARLHLGHAPLREPAPRSPPVVLYEEDGRQTSFAELDASYDGSFRRLRDRVRRLVARRGGAPTSTPRSPRARCSSVSRCTSIERAEAGRAVEHRRPGSARRLAASRRKVAGRRRGDVPARGRSGRPARTRTSRNPEHA